MRNRPRVKMFIFRLPFVRAFENARFRFVSLNFTAPFLQVMLVTNVRFKISSNVNFNYRNLKVFKYSIKFYLFFFKCFINYCILKTDKILIRFVIFFNVCKWTFIFLKINVTELILASNSTVKTFRIL